MGEMDFRQGILRTLRITAGVIGVALMGYACCSLYVRYTLSTIESDGYPFEELPTSVVLWRLGQFALGALTVLTAWLWRRDRGESRGRR